MLEKVRAAAGDRAGITFHGEVESRVIVLDRIDKVTDIDLNLQLLTDLTAERFLRALPRLNLPAGKLPSVLEFTISALRREHLAFLHNHRSHHIYCLHCQYFIKSSHILRPITHSPTSDNHTDSSSCSCFSCNHPVRSARRQYQAHCTMALTSRSSKKHIDILVIISVLTIICIQSNMFYKPIYSFLYKGMLRTSVSFGVYTNATLYLALVTAT